MLREAWIAAGLAEPPTDEYAYTHGAELYAQLLGRYDVLAQEATALRPSLAGVRGERDANARGAAAEYARVRELEQQRMQMIAAVAGLVRAGGLPDRWDNGRPFARSMPRIAGVA